MWCKWGLWNTLAIHHYLALYLVLGSLAGRPPHPCRVRLPLYFSRGISKAGIWAKQQYPIILHVFSLVSVVTAQQCSEIRHFAIWRAALAPCGQLVYDALITQKGCIHRLSAPWILLGEGKDQKQCLSPAVPFSISRVTSECNENHTVHSNLVAILIHSFIFCSFIFSSHYSVAWGNLNYQAAQNKYLVRHFFFFFLLGKFN